MTALDFRRFGHEIVDWIASEAKIDSSKDKNLPLAERLFDREGAEFQIRRSRFTGKQWRLRVEVRDFNGKLPDIVFPAASTRENIEEGAVLKLN